VPVVAGLERLHHALTVLALALTVAPEGFLAVERRRGDPPTASLSLPPLGGRAPFAAPVAFARNWDVCRFAA
jgi:hypothetical protein